MTAAIGEFEITGWAEDTYLDLSHGGKLTRATVTQTFSGDIVGTGDVQWLMCYRSDGTAHFVGLQHIAGSVGGREGSLVIETVGDFDGTKARGSWSIVAGSGTDALSKIRGQGDFEAPMGPKAWFTLEYEL